MRLKILAIILSLLSLVLSIISLILILNKPNTNEDDLILYINSCVIVKFYYDYNDLDREIIELETKQQNQVYITDLYFVDKTDYDEQFGYTKYISAFYLDTIMCEELKI